MFKPRIEVLFHLTLLMATGASAAIVELNPTADTFTRAAVSNGSYGSAGTTSVSGPTATNAAGVANGVFESFLRFDGEAAAGAFDAQFGAGHWTVSGVNLVLTEVGAPNNATFNRGAGTFEIRWITNDSWEPGTGSPNSPGNDGITYATQGAILSGADVSLGTFANQGANGMRTYALPLASDFLGDVSAGGLLSFYLSAVNPATGFNFSTTEFITSSAWPVLQITAVPEPDSMVVFGLGVFGLALKRRIRSGEFRNRCG